MVRKSYRRQLRPAFVAKSVPMIDKSPTLSGQDKPALDAAYALYNVAFASLGLLPDPRRW